jgi:glycosyltransferase involved in cell wall biosynthesis
MNSGQPTVSVVMPSFNHEKFINDAIRSVLSQSLSVFELIIVDDGSKDSSTEIIRKWVGQDPRIRALFHSKNLGISRTVNDGICTAKGKYITFLASDDMFRPQAFEKALSVIEKDSACGAVVFEIWWIDGMNRSISLFSKYYANITRQSVDFLRNVRSLQRDAVFNLLARHEGLIGMNCLVRKSVLEDYDIQLDERVKYGNDTLFGLELSLACELAYIEEPLYLHRIHKDNTYNMILRRDALEADHITYLQIVLAKYWNSLDQLSRRILFYRLARSYFAVGDFSKAREYFALAADHSPHLIGRMSMILLLLSLRLASANRFLLLLFRKLQQIRTKIFERVTADGKQRAQFSKRFAAIWEIDKKA